MAPDTSEHAHEILDWSRILIEPALREAVDSLPGKIRLIAGYHIGWWDATGQPGGFGAGKAFRPALALLAAEAVAGRAAAGLSGAVAVELVHNFSLLQDDVMDRDATRRHRPAAWTVFGTSAAILTADALLALAFSTLARDGTAGPRILGDAVNEMLAGQHEDLEFETRAEVSIDDSRAMAQGKSGALIGCSCGLGALGAGGGDDAIDSLTTFGRYLGLAFQFADDLLGIWGDPAVTGKPVHSDLKARKKTLPIVMALLSGGPEAEQLGSLYRSPEPLSALDLRRAADLVDATGARLWCMAQTDLLLAKAQAQLSGPGIAAPVRARLLAIAHFATRRDR